MSFRPPQNKTETDIDWYLEVPKVELHGHLESTIPLVALLELIQKYGGDPSVPDIAALSRRFEYKNFNFEKPWYDNINQNFVCEGYRSKQLRILISPTNGGISYEYRQH
jgi:hypothetical protein